MRDLSLHVLDLVMNSIEAQATKIQIDIMFNEKKQLLKVRIKDNGCGMSPEVLQSVRSPFYTSRKVRRVGLGIPLFLENIEKTHGQMILTSKVNRGTTLIGLFHTDHIDCIPFGCMKETISTLIMLNPDIHFLYRCIKNNEKVVLNTLKIKKRLKEVPINHNEVMNWIREVYLWQS